MICQSTVEDIDNVLLKMINEDANERPAAAEALKALVEVVSSIPPKNLLIPPIVYDLNSPVPKEKNCDVY